MGEQNQPGINPDDLDLIDDALEDEGKDPAALWEEFDRAETAAATGDPTAEPSPEKSGDGDGADGQPGAAAAADDSDDSAANREPDPARAGQPSDDSPSDDGRGTSQEADIWASAPPEFRAAYEAAQKDWESRDRRLRGQVSALQRKLDEFISRSAPAGTPPAQGSAPAKGDGQADTFLASKDWKDFQAEYPEVAGPIGAVIQSLAATIQQQQQQLGVIRAEREEQALDDQEEALTAAHPDWEQVVDHAAFGPWLEKQPRYVRDAFARNAQAIIDAEEAADIVGRFKQSNPNWKGDSGGSGGNGAPANGQGNGTTQGLSGKRQRQLESAATARTRAPAGITSGGPPPDADPETLWKWFDQLEARQQAGRA